MDVASPYGPGARMARKAEEAQAALFHRVGARELRAVLGPVTFFLFALTLLIYDHVQGGLSQGLFWLGVVLVVGVFAWLLETIGASLRMISEQRRDAMLDRSTGLRNREKLHLDLDAAPDTEEMLLLLLEVEGLRAYEHPAGDDAVDQLLQRVAGQLRAAASTLGGTAYRVDSTRFAVVLRCGADRANEVIVQATASLALETDSALDVTYGEVAIPADADGHAAAMQLASRRLLTRKGRQARSPRRQASAALVAVLEARRPELRAHRRAVVPHAIAVGRRLGLEADELDDLVLAATLQDIGLLTVPEEVLAKRTPLTASERALIEQHPQAGERIIAAAPALAAVASLVRSTYERVDGSGYPDGLVAAEIPLGARIIAVCVAAAAMTSARHHRPALSLEAAVAELRRCAGSQFDSDAVEALVAELIEESASADRVAAASARV